LDPVSLAIRFALALWVGGTLLVVLAAPVVFRTVPSRDTAGAVFGEILRRFEAVKQVLSLVLVIGVFVNLERGGGLSGRAIPAAIAIFLAIATNVYLAMVLRPRMNYFRMKVGSFDVAPRGGAQNEGVAPDHSPWRRRFDALHRRSTRVLVLGWVAAAVGLALWP
jgi:hypothetical protein